MQTTVVSVVNPQGLHVRACARIVAIASKFRSTVSLTVKGRRASARNIVAVMLLTASVGATVRIEVDGPDEAQAMREIAALFHDGLGERS
jgi:phosphocarrier protein HPr